MSETIQAQNYVLVLKKNWFVKTKTGDIIAFKMKERGRRAIFIKRVVAKQADEILSDEKGIIINNISYPHDSVYSLIGLSNDKVNKDIQYFNYLVDGNYIPEESGLNSGKFILKVPPKSYFVIGDNHFESMDSRFWGFIHEDQVIGKVVAVF